MAMLAVTIIPIIIPYLIRQKYIVKRVAAGAVKGATPFDRHIAAAYSMGGLYYSFQWHFNAHL